MKYIQLFMMLCFACSNLIQAITVNGQDINQIARSDEMIVFDNAQSSGVSLGTSADGNITVRSLELTRHSERDVSKHYNMLEEYQCELTEQCRKQVCMRAGNAMHNDGAYIAAVESVALSAGASMTFRNSILRSVDIYLESPQIAFIDSFVDADTLTLAPTSPDSIVERIMIVFDRESSVPPLITGFIDFQANEIAGSMQQGMTIMGAKTVIISFAPHAFSPNQDYNSEDSTCCNDEVINPLPETSAQAIQDMPQEDAQHVGVCEQEAHEIDDEQRDQVIEAEDESELLNEMALEQEEVHAMQERDICAQEVQLLEATDDIHEQQLMNECELDVKACQYSDELPLDNVKCDLDEAARCAACATVAAETQIEEVNEQEPVQGCDPDATACEYSDELPLDDVRHNFDDAARCVACAADSDESQDEKEEAPAITKLQEYEALPEAKIAKTELYVPVCASAAPVCCKSTGCARVEKVQRGLATHKRSSKLLNVLRGPVGVIMGVVAVGALGQYAYTHLLAPACNQD